MTCNTSRHPERSEGSVTNVPHWQQMLQLCFSMTIFLISVAPALANDDSRAYDLFRQIKCPVCAGQPIAESNTEVAIAMRAYIIEAIANGQSDAQIINHFRQQYGDSMVTKPALALDTFIIWLVPGLVFVMGGWWIFKRQSSS